MNVILDVNIGCVNGIASKIILKGSGKALMSVNIIKIIGTINNAERGPTNAWALLTSSAKTDIEIANANAESIETKSETPRSK